MCSNNCCFLSQILKHTENEIIIDVDDGVSGDDELVSYVHMESIETAEDGERLTIAEEIDNQDEIQSADPQQEILLVIEDSDFQSFKVSHKTA